MRNGANGYEQQPIKVDALFNLSLEEARKNIEPDSTLDHRQMDEVCGPGM